MTDPETAPRRQRHQAMGKGPVIASAVVHTAAIFLAWWTTAATSEIPDFVVFEVRAQ